MATSQENERVRCPWPGADPLYVRYHDEEWGVPVHDDRKLFEFLTLEGAQAGLSWITILRKRAAYALAFENFDAGRVASYGDAEVERLLGDPGIVRNGAKIRSAIGNARAFLRVREEFGSFDAYMWRFVDGEPVVNAWTDLSQLPASTPLSETMSKDLKKRGFSFIGPTVCYAHMQAVGMVNDHLVTCFRYEELTRRPCAPSRSARTPEGR
jgi:DNA-3-methyladenine glycosylase I